MNFKFVKQLVYTSVDILDATLKEASNFNLINMIKNELLKQ